MIHAVRATRLIYVENDAFVRGIMTREFDSSPGIELLLATGSPTAALTSDALLRADAALLDLTLGPDELNGIELGLVMRERNPNIGIVIHSQHSLRNMMRRVPPEEAMGWSFMPKSGDMDMDHLRTVIRETAHGMSHDLGGSSDAAGAPSDLDRLSSRQRAVMAYAATGVTAPEIARRLGISHDAARKELSRAYRLLVPDAEGTDIRTKAILVYLSHMETGDGPTT